MKRSLAAALALVALVVAAVIATGATAAPARTQAGSLVGTRRDVPVPADLEVDSRGREGLRHQHHVLARPGRAAGIASITARSVDFGASDAPLSSRISSTPARAASSSPGRSLRCRSPTTCRASTVGSGSTGRRSCNIYLGTITNWNDPAIKRLNPKLNLPDLKITPVYRSDGSGTTYAYTDYLSAVSPQWKSRVGTNTSVSFPAGIGARGSSGVTGVVKSTPGALTYVDAAYSIQNKLQFALVQNKAGKFTTPGLRGISAALSQLPKKVTALSQLKIVDPPKSAGPLAYPIVDVHLRDPADELEQGGRSAEVRLLGRHAGPEVRPAALLRPASEHREGVRISRDRQGEGGDVGT